MSFSEDGFIQDYDLGAHQELWLYCRICRRAFPVIFKPRSRKVRLKCLCGHEGPLDAWDVFRDEDAATVHAAFYENVYRAAKGALRDAGIPLPPSARWSRADGVPAQVGLEGYFEPATELPGSASSSHDPEARDDGDLSGEGIAAGIADFERQLAEAGSDLFLRHEVLSELVVWSYCRRHAHPDAYARFVAACAEDVALAPALLGLAREALKGGQRLRITFTSFKHLVVDREEQGDLEGALSAAERAAQLGLKGYAERAAELRAKLG